MFGNRWLGDREHRNEFAYTAIPMLEYGEHFQAGGIGQCFQHLRQFFDVHIPSPSFIINLPYNYMVMQNKLVWKCELFPSDQDRGPHNMTETPARQMATPIQP